jgi:hypothetical protein
MLLPVVRVPRTLIPDQSSSRSSGCTIITTTAGEDGKTKKGYENYV